MARGENEPLKVVSDLAIKRRCGSLRRLGGIELQLVSAELRVAALDHSATAQLVDRATFGRRHQPRAGIVGHAGVRPALKRRHQRVLREILGEADVAHDACETGDQTRRFQPPNRFDSVLCVSGRHGHWICRAVGSVARLVYAGGRESRAFRIGVRAGSRNLVKAAFAAKGSGRNLANRTGFQKRQPSGHEFVFR
jgi:hypothetical protein